MQTCQKNIETIFGKFIAKWEGPYIIYDITFGGSYKIKRNREKEDLSWNSKQFKKYYF